MAGQNRTPKAPKCTAKPAIWRKAFLARLAKSGNISAACRSARVARSRAYELRRTDEAFADAWDEALEEAADALEAEARRRAVEGTLKPMFYKGKRIHTKVLEYSDGLLMFLLKGARPNIYRENYQHVHSGHVGITNEPDLSDKSDEQVHDYLATLAGVALAGTRMATDCGATGSDTAGRPARDDPAGEG